MGLQEIAVALARVEERQIAHGEKLDALPALVARVDALERFKIRVLAYVAGGSFVAGIVITSLQAGWLQRLATIVFS